MARRRWLGRTVLGHGEPGTWRSWRSTGAAADMSDNTDPMTVRSGSFVGWVDETPGWGWAFEHLDTGGMRSANNSTCNVWQDQHNNLRLPDVADVDGFYRATARFSLSGIPPRVAEHLCDTVEIDTFGNRQGVMLRIGQTEHWDDQPLAFDTRERGMYAEWMQVADGRGIDGSKALVVQAGNSSGGLITTPQLNLEANTRYRFSAMVRVEGDATAEGFITGHLYEWSPHAQTWTHKQTSNSVSPDDGWTAVTIEFETPAWDPFMDPRFVCTGEDAVMYVDNVEIVMVDVGE